MGFWGIGLYFLALGAFESFWRFLIGVFLFPILIVVVPFYSGFARGDWKPVLVICGGSFVYALLGFLAVAVGPRDYDADL